MTDVAIIIDVAIKVNIFNHLAPLVCENGIDLDNTSKL